ncbi:MAG: hypothetical protein K5907_09530 [Treponema sp.]|nr:hypothetical protein [Treponema sp.]
MALEQKDLEAFLIPIKGEDWRDIYNSIVYVRCKEKMEVLKKAGFDVDNRNDGFIALCFIDHQEGLSFYVIAAAHLRGENIFVSKENKSSAVILRAVDLADAPYLNSNYINVDISKYDYYAGSIIDKYEKDIEEAVEMRDIEELDSFRKPYFPDEIEVVLLGKDGSQEKVFVLGSRYGSGCLFGVLINEPALDFGIHKGQEIDFMVIDKAGSLCTVHVKK